MPRYRFQWDSLPPYLLRQLSADLELGPGTPAQQLRKAFGARPDEGLVRVAWPSLLEGWLTRDDTARRSVVAALRLRHLGQHGPTPASEAAEIEYLRSCRNGPGLREVVLDHLITAGEPTSTPKPAPTQAAPAASVAPVAGSVGERRTSIAWPSFAAALAASLAALEEDQYLILSLKRHPPYYVQFAAQGPSGVRAETVSNAHLEEWEHLDPRAEKRLGELGWHQPTGAPENATPERDPDGSPNHYRDWDRPVPFAEVADLAVRTLVEVFEVPHPGYLAYRAFARDGADILLPNLGVSREKPSAVPEHGLSDGMTPEELRRRVAGALKPMLADSEPDYDSDGDIPLRFGSAVAFVRIATDAPVIEVFAPLLWDVPQSEQLLQAINELNRSLRYARAIFTGKGVILSAEVLGVPFVAEHLINACVAVGNLTDQHDEEFQERFGGRVSNGAALPAKEPESNAGYL